MGMQILSIEKAGCKAKLSLRWKLGIAFGPLVKMSTIRHYLCSVACVHFVEFIILCNRLKNSS